MAESAPQQTDAADPYLQDSPVAAAPAPAQPPAPAAPQYSPGGGPKGMAENDRTMATYKGDVLSSELQQERERQQGRNRWQTDYLDEQYEPLIHGQGGYTDQEKRGISQDPYLGSLDQTNEEREQAYLTPEEGAGIQGNAAGQSKWFDPGAERQYGDAMASELGAAGVDTAGRIRSQLDPSKINVSDKFLQDYQMSPEEQQGYLTGAAMDVRTANQAHEDALGRAARAAGVDPVGAAAMGERMHRQAAADSADAMTKARIAANQERARRLQTGEQMRVNAAQGAGALTNSAESGIMNRGISAEDLARGTQIGTERSIADRGMGMERNIDTTNSDRARYLSENRQAGAAYNSGQRFNRGSYIYGNRNANETNYANARRQDQQEGRGYLGQQQAMTNANANHAMDQRVGLYGTQQQAVEGATRNRAVAEGTPGLGERIFGTVLGAASNAAKAFGGGKTGGVITEPTYLLAGEDGPEALIPLNPEDESKLSPAAAPGRYVYGRRAA